MKPSESKEEYPLFCDYSCKYAAFSPPDSSGACRRDISVYCKKMKKYNNKNSRCLLAERSKISKSVK